MFSGIENKQPAALDPSCPNTIRKLGMSTHWGSWAARVSWGSRWSTATLVGETEMFIPASTLCQGITKQGTGTNVAAGGRLNYTGCSHSGWRGSLKKITSFCRGCFSTCKRNPWYLIRNIIMAWNESVGMKRPSSLTGSHCTAQSMRRTSFIHSSIHPSTRRLGYEQ